MSKSRKEVPSCVIACIATATVAVPGRKAVMILRLPT